MDHIEAIRATLRDLPPSQQEAVQEALQLLAYEADPSAYDAGLSIIAAYTRVLRKRQSDKTTDRRRRVLVGARVSRAEAARYRAAAEAQDMSLYAWIHAALDAAAAASDNIVERR